ncbi:hypothetical protein BGX27_001956 [Mortierella sp. AM989]|nr:hypothetical protein BGX27_001956 [Mortierella sp. AM989]
MTSTSDSSEATRPNHPMSPSPALTLFNIPLLVDFICQHLSTREIFHCSLVSHDLFNAFSPHLSEINLERRVTYNKWVRKETQAALASRPGTIRSLTSVFGDTYKHLAQLALTNPSALYRLTVLRCRIISTSRPNLVKNKQSLPSILTVIEHSPNLQVLELGFFDFDNSDSVTSLLSAIRKRGRGLQEVWIGNDELVDCKTLQWILWSCAAVQRLTLNIDLYQPWDEDDVGEEPLLLEAMAKEALFGETHPYSELDIQSRDRSGASAETGSELVFALMELHVHFSALEHEVKIILEFLRHTPLIERLTVPGIIKVPTLLQEVASTISTVSLPRLQHLDFQYAGGGSSLTCIQLILESCKNLKSVVLTRTHGRYLENVNAIISGSSHSLESIKFPNTHLVPSESLELILCACPRLKKLEALITLHDIQTSRLQVAFPADLVLEIKEAVLPESQDLGWICRDLETLYLSYRNHDGSLGISEPLRRQIAKLIKLKDLRLRCKSYEETARSRDSLQDALLEWRTLTDLRTLELQRLQPLVDEKELSRIRQQWAKLEWIQYT